MLAAPPLIVGLTSCRFLRRIFFLVYIVVFLHHSTAEASAPLSEMTSIFSPQPDPILHLVLFPGITFLCFASSETMNAIVSTEEVIRKPSG